MTKGITFFTKVGAIDRCVECNRPWVALTFVPGGLAIRRCMEHWSAYYRRSRGLDQ